MTTLSFYSTTQQPVNVKNPKYIEFVRRLQWLVFQMLLSLTLHALKQQVIFLPKKSLPRFNICRSIYIRKCQSDNHVFQSGLNFANLKWLKVSKSRKQFMVSWILPKNERRYHRSKVSFFFWENPGDHKLLSRFTDL